ncbi:uncharacterized protein LOC142768311 [Rhipicephalus microplus]|uniref:uncharacterized protein LOC142768311 n=1 Tax=Rhipicephalus microplus TaxID=6941 RepID=UPI003F6B2274
MYPNYYCDYLFYTDVYPEGGRIYEKDGSYPSWLLFQRMAARRPNIEFGLSFAFEYVTPGSLEHVADILGGLRRLRIKHYGFLTALTFAGEYRVTLQFIRVLMGSLKYMQGSDREAKTVLASGVYDYSAEFMPTFETEFRHSVNTFVADIFIAIISAGWSSPTGSCDAIPPNSFKTVNMSHATLVSFFYTTYKNDDTQ